MDTTSGNTDTAGAAKKAKKKFVHPKKTAEERKKDKESRQQKRARIIVRNISFKTSDEDLRKEFAKYGTIKECDILKREDGKLVGCGFIQFEKVNQAAKAIHHGNGKDVGGRPIILDWAVNRKKFVAHTKTAKKEAKVQQLEVKEEETTDNEMDVTIKTEDGASDDGAEDGQSDDDDDDGDAEAGDDDDQSLVDEKKPIHKKSNDVAEGCTVFIKNIPFDATDDDLRKVCRQFGPLRYALVTKDKTSGHSKGTGFVKFLTPDSANMCLNAGTSFKIHDQVLDPHAALSRNEVQQKKKPDRVPLKDSRNLFLAKEGVILAGTPAAEGVSQSDLSKRLRLEQSKNQSLKNLNRFLSMERLTVHNIPPTYDSTKLRQVMAKACGLKPKECRVMRENKPSVGNPLGKSKGFGFLSFKNHDDALACLRKVNNNPHVFGKNNRPIVSFSIEDRAVHNIKMKRLKKSQDKNPLFKKKTTVKTTKKPDRDVKPKVAKQKPADNGGAEAAEPQLANFAGSTAKEGTHYKARPLWKMREDSSEHNKTVKSQKKLLRKQQISKSIRAEKRQIERPKMGKRKDVDVDGSLVNKYLKLLHKKDDGKDGKPKRTKWYTG